MSSLLNKYQIEVCVASVASAIAAEQGGANRVELCDNLFEGGTTPSPGMLYCVRNAVKLDVFVMIRPRGGDFLYSEQEYQIMKADIAFAKNCGADGVVLGVLREDGSVDVERTKELVELAHPMPVTFHRAIDMSNNIEQAVEDVIKTGCSRILTSGQANKAFEGMTTIKKMMKKANGQIDVMVGSGINDTNIKEIINKTKATQFHLSGKETVKGKMKYQNKKIAMGSLPQIPEYDYVITNSDKIKSVCDILNTLP